MTIKAKEDFSLTRIKKGFSITGLAKKMKVNPSVALALERGRSIRPATAKKACDALQMSFEDLFTIED